MVFSPSDVIKIKNTGEEKLNISVDGRYFSALLPGEVCIARVSQKKVKILSFNENNMFATLFKKMRILEDVK
jgi:NAD kinase